jgi:hypothetical protein
MNWIDINDKLPVQMNSEEESEHMWVPVTDGESKLAIAKCFFDSKKNDFVWRFWEANKVTFCPHNKYQVHQMTTDEIKFWLDIWSTIVPKEENN